MQKILPNLWFNTEAEEAAQFYARLFNDSSVGKTTHYGKAGHEIHGMKEGTVMTVEFTLHGQKFLALNGGPAFKFNPSVSFFVTCKSPEEVNAFWQKLIEGGKELMPLGSYPFSERYGWLEDKFGLSWQIMYAKSYKAKQKIVPTLMFAREMAGKAEEAAHFYTSIFRRGSEIGGIARYEAGEGADKPGTVKHGAFVLEGQEFYFMDSAGPHEFGFNEAISFIVLCDNQEEIDYYWERLREGGDPQSEQCGWLKDKYGLSWQVAPALLNDVFSGSDSSNKERLMEAFLKMKKIDLETLEKLS